MGNLALELHLCNFEGVGVVGVMGMEKSGEFRRVDLFGVYPSPGRASTLVHPLPQGERGKGATTPLTVLSRFHWTDLPSYIIIERNNNCS